MLKIFSTFTVFFTILSTSYTQAQENIPAGITVIHLQESAQAKVAQDRIRATLSLEKENYDVARLQNSINKIMEDAVKKAKDRKEISINTGTYRVYKTYKGEKEAREEIWRGSQSLTVEGADKAEILELVADLQSLGFAQADLSYTLSPELTQKWRNSLMEKAISNIQERASKVSTQLKMPNVRIVELNLQDHVAMPRQRYGGAPKMMTMAAESMAQPVLESSGEEIKVTVTAKVYLKSE